MGAADRTRHLSDAEQEVLLFAVEGTDLFTVIWGLRGIVGEGTDEDLRPQADLLIRTLVSLGLLQLVRVHHDRLPPGEHRSVDLVGGGALETDRVLREEPIPTEAIDVVLRDPKSWRPFAGESEVVLATTIAGDMAVANGAIHQAYAKFMHAPKRP